MKYLSAFFVLSPCLERSYSAARRTMFSTEKIFEKACGHMEKRALRDDTQQ